MGKEDAIEVVVAAPDVEKGEPESTTPVEPANATCGACICSSSADATTDAHHVLALRFLGAASFIFAVIEFGLGGGLFNFFDNAKMGAWWVGLILALASICAMVSVNRGWIISTCIISSASCVVAIVGAAYDGTHSHMFRGLTACSKTHDAISTIYNYGNSNDFGSSLACLMDSQVTGFVSDGCYCASKFGSDCYEFTLSNYATYYDQNCGSILTDYTNVMSTSAAFCVFCFVMALALSILSGVILCCAHRLPSGSNGETEDKDHIPDEVIVNEASPADASVVPPAEVELKVGQSVIA